VVTRDIDLIISLDRRLAEIKESVSVCERAVILLIASCQAGETMGIDGTALVLVGAVFAAKENAGASLYEL
jgi:hypothetical protein